MLSLVPGERPHCTLVWFFINIWNFNFLDIYCFCIVKLWVLTGEWRLCQPEQVHQEESFEPISEAIGCSSFLTFLRPPSRPEAKFFFRKGSGINYFSLQTKFQQNRSKDEEITGIFHFSLKYAMRAQCEVS